jgi:glycosyltransferase involved in cell wall biosynthesis
MQETGAAPRVSIVCIFLNEERFLGEAIESVLAQSLSDWELILVDDGSTDGSTTIARDHAARDPDRIRYLAHPEHRNLGKSTSRNLGIRAARGEFITFLDADDAFLPDKLERQVRLLEMHPGATMVYGRTEYWYGWTGARGDLRRDFIPGLGPLREAAFEPPALMTRFLRHGGWVPCICSVLARTAAVVEVGGFDEGIQHLFEDQVLLAKLCLVHPVLFESGCGERYRQHAGSSSSIAVSRGEYHPLHPNSARGVYLDWLSTYAARHGITDRAFWKALRLEVRLNRHPIVGRVAIPILRLARSAAAWLRSRDERVPRPGPSR